MTALRGFLTVALSLVAFASVADGAKLDPDEIDALEHLCAAAAQAYTGIELEHYQRASTPLSALLG